MLKEQVVIFSEFLRSFRETGELLPTSRAAAMQLLRPLQNKPGPRRILEIGAGTGAISKEILPCLRPEDRLILCEINKRLFSILQLQLSRSKEFKARQHQVDFFCGPFQDLREDCKFDAFICSLPFLNFDSCLVAEVFDKIERLASPGAQMSYYEFSGFRLFGKLIGLPSRRARIKAVDETLCKCALSKKIDTARVWQSLPPIDVHILKVGDTAQILNKAVNS